ALELEAGGHAGPGAGALVPAPGLLAVAGAGAAADALALLVLAGQGGDVVDHHGWGLPAVSPGVRPGVVWSWFGPGGSGEGGRQAVALGLPSPEPPCPPA